MDKQITVPAKQPRLSLKQRLFCQAYIELHGNGTEAVLRAGYGVSNKEGHVNINTAKSIASENLTKPYIKAYIGSLLERSGLNEQNVAIQHWYLVNQNDDLGVKAKAIDMWYKLKGKYNQLSTYETENQVVFESVIQRIRTILPP